MKDKVEPQETDAEKHYRLLIQLLLKADALGEIGALNKADLFTKEIGTFWRTEKTAAKNKMTAKAKSLEKARAVKRALGKLTSEERQLLKAG